MKQNCCISLVLLLSFLSLETLGLKTSSSPNSTNGEYEIYIMKNVTKFKSKACECELEEPKPWSTWTACRSQTSDIRPRECHEGYRYRLRICSADSDDPCTTQQWQNCYHKKSCKGQWENVINDSACSQSCGTGFRIQLSICLKDNVVGLFCVSNGRRSYIYNYTKCNTQACPINQEITGLFSPNLSTWTAITVGVIAVIITAATVAFCFKSRRQDRKNKTSTEANTSAAIYQDFNQRRTSATESNQQPSPDSKESKIQPVVAPESNNFPPPPNDFPDVPPTLHHSFYKGEAVPSENAVYTLASPTKAIWKKAFYNAAIENYVESTSFINDAEKNKALLPLPDLQDQQFTETASTNFGSNHNMDPTRLKQVNTFTDHVITSFGDEEKGNSLPNTLHGHNNNHTYSEIPFEN